MWQQEKTIIIDVDALLVWAWTVKTNNCDERQNVLFMKTNKKGFPKNDKN